ncbi:hypothetical protein CF326_g8834 [Tilletia indica]|nr:hypothetical protein CF326_g8834 [Tilletia indica]
MVLTFAPSDVITNVKSVSRGTIGSNVENLSATDIRPGDVCSDSTYDLGETLAFGAAVPVANLTGDTVKTTPALLLPGDALLPYSFFPASSFPASFLA